MSEMIGETFVSIVPIVNEAEFAAQVESQVKTATAQVKVAVPVVPVQAQLQAQSESAAAVLKQAETVAAVTGQKLLVGQATIAESAAALDAYAAAGLAAARAEVELDVALGRSSAAENIAILQRERLTQTTLQLDGAERRRGAGGELRTAIRGVATGEAPASSLLGPGALLRFGAAGLAIGAVVSTVGALEKALKVSGDEAATTEGKIRNVGAALLTGNIVEAFGALGAKAERFTQDVKDAEKEARDLGRSVNLVSLADILKDSDKFKENIREAGTVYETSFTRVASPSGARVDIEATAEKTAELTQHLRDVALQASVIEPLLKKFPTPILNATEQADKLHESYGKSFETASRLLTLLQQIGREDLLGKAVADAGAATRSPLLTAGGNVPPGATDPTNVPGTRQATAEARARQTPGLQDDIAQARREERDAINTQKALEDRVKGRAARARAVVEARTKVVLLERQQAQEEKRAADEAASAAKQAQNERERAAADRARQFRQGLDFREQTLQFALQEARATENTIADDRKALLALIRFNHAKSQNLRLERDERLAAAAEEKSLRKDLSDLNRQALADALGVREQNLRNAIEAAKLTDRTDDDDKANNAFLRFLKGQVANARKLKDGGKALADAKADLIAFQLSLKGAKQQGGFSVQDLFQEAAHEFSAFASNVTPTAEGPLSPQDARGLLATDVLARAGTAGGGLDLGRLADATLTEAQKQTRLLAAIVAALGGGPGVVPEGAGFRPARESGGVGSLDAINVNQAAAIFGIT